MVDVAALIADLVAAGTPPALVGRVAAALSSPSSDDELSADRRERDRIRKRIYRDKSKVASEDSPRTVRGTVTSPSPPPAPFPKEISQTLLENNPSPLPPPQPFSLSAGDEFECFWEKFPNKVGKADARKAFPKAVTKVDPDQMLAALDRYVHKTDDRPWCNPATWLNQERWTDQPASAMPRASPRRESPIEIRRRELAERIENEHGIRRERGGDPPDADLLRISFYQTHR